MIQSSKYLSVLAMILSALVVAATGQALDPFGNGTIKTPTTASGGTGTVANLQTDNDVNYSVARGATASIGGFGTHGGTITSVYLFVQYSVETGYTGTNPIKINGVNTTIVPTVRDYGRWAYVDITAGTFGVNTSAEISTLSVTFNNNDGSPSNAVLFDCMYVVVNPQTAIPTPPTWSEDFNGTGQANPMIWNYEVGYQRNNELQYYVPGASNGWMEGGNFIIEGRRESIYAGHDYTSASIITTNKFYWKYGRTQIRAKIPCLPGMWPAIWGTGEVGQWPHNGEVDILEYYGNKILANCAVGTTTAWSAKWDPYTDDRFISSLTSVDPNWKTQWHIWTMQWDEDNVRIYVDNILMGTVPQTWLVNTAGYNTSWGPQYPFKQGMSCWLNLAMGGAGGDPSGTAFPQRYLIDYWKIWEGATGNVAPTDIALSGSGVTEGQAIGTVVGNLSATDADSAEVLRYTLVTGTGDTHNSQFRIPEFVSDNTTQGVIKTGAVLNYMDGATRSIRVRVTDIEGATYDKILTINVIRTGQHVTYNGNGSTGGTVPLDSIGYPQGTMVTVRGNTGNLIRSGYNFAGWNTAANGSGTTYASGNTFAIGAVDVTLYAIWTTAPTYTVSYNGNSQSSGTAPNNQIKTQGVNITLATNSGNLARTGYTFAGWNTSPNGTGTSYAVSANYSTDGTVTLYAKWNALPVANAGVTQTVYLTAGQSWTPANVTTAAWYDAADASSITHVSGVVSQWNDKSGNARHVLQTTSANRPSYSASAWNGSSLPALTFDGTSDYLESTSTFTQPTVTMLAVFDQAKTTSSSRPFGVRTPTTNSKNNFSFDSDNSLRYDGAFTVGTIAASIGKHFRIASRTSSAQTDFVDGTQNINASVALTTNTSGYINVGNPVATYAGPFSSKVAEAILISSTISLATQEQFEGYFAHKWGLTGNLPAAHPYKSSAPSTASATATLAGSASDAEGSALTTTWSKLSGPGTVTFSNALALNSTASFPVAGNYTLRLTVSDGLGQSTSDVVITVSPPSTYGTWSTGTFLNPPFTNNGPTGNPDGDSLTNLQEFAFGLDPTSATTRALSFIEGGALNATGTPIFVKNGTTNLAVFTRRKDYATASLTYSVWFSADLVSWIQSTDTPTLRTSAADPSNYEAVSVPYPTSVPTPKFFKVGVVSN